MFYPPPQGKQILKSNTAQKIWSPSKQKNELSPCIEDNLTPVITGTRSTNLTTNSTRSYVVLSYLPWTVKIIFHITVTAQLIQFMKHFVEQ